MVKSDALSDFWQPEGVDSNKMVMFESDVAGDESTDGCRKVNRLQAVVGRSGGTESNAKSSVYAQGSFDWKNKESIKRVRFSLGGINCV